MTLCRLTPSEFTRTLKRAAIDDQRWPNLDRFMWLLNHATVTGELVELRWECHPANGLGHLEK